MDKVIIIKYGELTTKKDNINYFIKVLKNNIINSLVNIEYEITYDKTRMFIYSNNLEEVIKRLKSIFGIYKFTIGYKIDNDMDSISSSSLELLKDEEFNTFKVITKRSNKSYPLNSMEVSKKIGAYLLKNIKGIKVDVHNPDLFLNIEIRKDDAYIYFEDIMGIGGYPVSTLGKGLLMLSGGIDSPVAGYLAMKRGIKIECVYFEAPPHTSLEAKNKVLELARKLAVYNTEIKVHIINFSYSSHFLISGLITGCLGTNIVQQSSKGKILVLYVSILLAKLIISNLSKQATGLITGISTTLLIAFILVSV